MKTSITVFTYPRSGSSWLCQMLSDYLDCPFTGLGNKKPLGAEGQKRTASYVVYQTHKLITIDTHSILISRDPRDISVSANHYWQINDLGETIRKMAKGTWPLTHGGGWLSFMETADQMEFGYEIDFADLKISPVHSIYAICKNLDLPCDQERIKEIVNRHTFQARLDKVAKDGDSMPYGREVQERHLRKGVVGDWRNHYTPALAKLANSFWGDRLLTYGYEIDQDWWKYV